MYWNSLGVPLGESLQCLLVPAGEYRSPSGDWLVFVKDEERKQLEQDRRDFDQHFCLSFDLERSSDRRALDDIRSFVRDYLNVAHWNQPTNGKDAERVLRAAVLDGRLVPVVNRNWRADCVVFRPTPTPLRWPSSGGARSISSLFSSVGVFGERTVSASDGGVSEWGSAVENPAMGVSGAPRDFEGDGVADGDFHLPSLAVDGPSLQQDEPVGAEEQDAGVFLTPAEEAECELQYKLDMAECGAYAAMQKSTWGVCKERAMNRYANCLRGWA